MSSNNIDFISTIVKNYVSEVGPTVNLLYNTITNAKNCINIVVVSMP
jgi:hypothetical protein